MIIIGIDPGLTGAVFFIENDGPLVADTPTIVMAKSSGKGKKTDYLPADMAKLLRDYAPLNCHVFIEKIGAMPGQGVTSMFGFGKGYGLWIGILAALEIPYTFVTPQAWKKVMMSGMADKDAARLRAQELWPSKSHLFARKKDIGRADAALIAEYGRRTMK